MPSAKYTFLTLIDELALSEALREKFPDIRFYHEDDNPGRHYRYFDDICSANTKTVTMCVGPHMIVPARVPNGRGGHSIINVSDEVLFLRRSPNVLRKRPLPTMRDGMLQVGVSPVMTQAQIKLANTVWRLLAKIGTYRLVALRADGTWREHIDKRIFAGNDAVRWALEHKERRFNYISTLRPMPPHGNA